jgi:hypothetical protein
VGEPLEKPARSALTVRHMIAAVGALVLVVLVLGFLSSGAGFTPAGPVTDPSAVRVVDAPAQLRGLASSVPFPVRAPATPSGWRANSVGMDVVGERKVVRAGYLTSSGTYVQLQQTDATEEALLAAGAGARNLVAQGAQDVSGLNWVVYGTRPGEPVWIADTGGVRLAITGSGSDDDFRTLAAAAK